MKQIAGLFLLLVVMMFSAAWLSKSGNTSRIFNIVTNSTPSPTPSPEPKKTMMLGSYQVEVEIADTQDKRQLGLSGRTSLDKGTGMLFIFEKQNTRPPFWMKGMNFPIDIVWVDNDKIVQLNTDVQPDPAGTPDDKLRLYPPNQPIDYVVELPAGTVRENKIRVGDKVELPTQ